MSDNIITIGKSNIDNEHICCAIGNDKENKARAESKKNWMKERFDEGLVFKRLDERGKVFVEYIPIENAWKPVLGENYLLINCLWVSGKFKGEGFGKKLLDEVIADAKQKQKAGIAIVSSTKVKGFLTDKKFFIKYGFEVCDTAKPYFELLILKFNPNAKNPTFAPNVKSEMEGEEDFIITFSNQCPFMEEYSALMAEQIKLKGKTVKIVKINSREDVIRYGSPFGTFGVFYKGRLISHELMPEKKFGELLDNLSK